MKNKQKLSAPNTAENGRFHDCGAAKQTCFPATKAENGKSAAKNGPFTACIAPKSIGIALIPIGIALIPIG
ncbi:hypothetical protein, partial [Candidatus Electronema sp. TJ]|uniref:hypothetical protein n=1 Tax=Candidatus Electronema sp. TJ TaxID=3401573 RepID=UPI003AA962EC